MLYLTLVLTDLIQSCFRFITMWLLQMLSVILRINEYVMPLQLSCDHAT